MALGATAPSLSFWRGRIMPSGIDFPAGALMPPLQHTRRIAAAASDATRDAMESHGSASGGGGNVRRAENGWSLLSILGTDHIPPADERRSYGGVVVRPGRPCALGGARSPMGAASRVPRIASRILGHFHRLYGREPREDCNDCCNNASRVAPWID